MKLLKFIIIFYTHTTLSNAIILTKINLAYNNVLNTDA